MVASLAACSLFSAADAIGARAAPPPASAKAPHLDDRFENITPIPQPSFAKVAGIFARFLFAEKTDPRPAEPMPVRALDAASFAEPPQGGYRVTWLGHSTTLIEIDGLRLLTDPVFGERASPFASMGPKRFQPAPIAIDDLPAIDAVILSHDHYDHLDMESIKALAPKVARFVTPLGVGGHLRQWGVAEAKITELDWWSQTELAWGVRAVAVPARHFSGRGLTDRNATLWASWVIEGVESKLFFSGDTGMHEEFALIGERFGPFDLAMIENGAYDPEWPDVHMSPAETVEAARMLRAEKLMPIHWGTFDLAHHAWYDPPEQVRRLADAAGLPLVQPRLGDSIGPGLPDPVAVWWRPPLERVTDGAPLAEATGS